MYIMEDYRKGYRKIPPELEHPIDNLNINIGAILSPYFKKLNFTPNTLTTISLITGLLSVYCYTQQNYIYSAILFYISYMFDCFDGYYARRYNMTSKFGDIYDHIANYVVISLILWVIYKNYRKFDDWQAYLPFGVIILIFISVVHLGCQEKYYNDDTNKKKSMMLQVFKYLCPAKRKSEIRKFMKISRYGNLVVTMLYICFLILYSMKIK